MIREKEQLEGAVLFVWVSFTKVVLDAFSGGQMHLLAPLL